MEVRRRRKASEVRISQDGSFSYRLLPNGKAEILRCLVEKGRLTVPESLDGHPVTAIGTAAFALCQQMTAVRLPKGLRNIGAEAFAYCKQLRGIWLPERLADLGEGAFLGCSQLRWVVFAGGRKTKSHCRALPQSCFASCKRLMHLRLPQNLKSIGKESFAGCGYMRHLRLPWSLEELEATAFAHCDCLVLTVERGSMAEQLCDAQKLDNHYPIELPYWMQEALHLTHEAVEEHKRQDGKRTEKAT